MSGIFLNCGTDSENSELELTQRSFTDI